MSTGTGMSFQTVALFPGSSLIKSKTSLLETVSKEKFWITKFSFIFLQLSSFSKLVFLVDSRRFKLLVIFVKYSLKVLEILLLSLRVSFFFCQNNVVTDLTYVSEKRLNCFPEFLVNSYFICT